MRVAGYVYRADIYCSGCIFSAMPGEWSCVPGGSAERQRDHLASQAGIDRLILAGQAHDICVAAAALTEEPLCRERCRQCGRCIGFECPAFDEEDGEEDW